MQSFPPNNIKLKASPRIRHRDCRAFYPKKSNFALNHRGAARGEVGIQVKQSQVFDFKLAHTKQPH